MLSRRAFPQVLFEKKTWDARLNSVCEQVKTIQFPTESLWSGEFLDRIESSYLIYNEVERLCLAIFYDSILRVLHQDLSEVLLPEQCEHYPCLVSVRNAPLLESIETDEDINQYWEELLRWATNLSVVKGFSILSHCHNVLDVSLQCQDNMRQKCIERIQREKSWKICFVHSFLDFSESVVERHIQQALKIPSSILFMAKLIHQKSSKRECRMYTFICVDASLDFSLTIRFEDQRIFVTYQPIRMRLFSQKRKLDDSKMWTMVRKETNTAELIHAYFRTLFRTSEELYLYWQTLKLQNIFEECNDLYWLVVEYASFVVVYEKCEHSE